MLGQTFFFGGQEFTHTEIVEAINMHNTGAHTDAGKQVVSMDYMRMHRKLSQALSRSSITIKQLTEALTNRDLTRLDDRSSIIQTLRAA